MHGSLALLGSILAIILQCSLGGGKACENSQDSRTNLLARQDKRLPLHKLPFLELCSFSDVTRTNLNTQEIAHK